MKKLLTLIILTLAFACNSKKPVEIIKTVVARDAVTEYANMNEDGLIVVTNIANDTLWSGNVHDTIPVKKPCIKCKKKGISLCERYRRENLRLWKKLEKCEKGDYYIPSKPALAEIPADTLPIVTK